MSNKKKKQKIQEDSDDELANETVDEKRIRLAKEYLQKMQADIDEDSEQEQFNTGDVEYEDESINRRLVKHNLRITGREDRKAITEKFDYNLIDEENISHKIIRAHRLPPTCLALAEDDTIAFTGSKDYSIVQYDVETGKKCIFNSGSKNEKQSGHYNEVMGVALSSDNIYLASVGKDWLVRVWDVRSKEQIYQFNQHRDAVSCCAFRKDSLSLYTGGYDRTINVYNIEQGTFVESLYGHQANINSLTALYQERVYSVSDDRTLRIWKIQEESQAILRSNPLSRSLDTIAALSANVFLTGAQDGSLSLWESTKRKPLDTVPNAHKGNWINSSAALYASDLAVTGSSDGYIRGWKADINTKKLQAQFQIPVVGHVNALALGRQGRFIAAAVGQEHRLGRWDRIQPARCGLHIIDLSKYSPTFSGDDDDDDLEEKNNGYYDEQTSEEEFLIR